MRNFVLKWFADDHDWEDLPVFWDSVWNDGARGLNSPALVSAPPRWTITISLPCPLWWQKNYSFWCSDAQTKCYQFRVKFPNRGRVSLSAGSRWKTRKSSEGSSRFHPRRETPLTTPYPMNPLFHSVTLTTVLTTYAEQFYIRLQKPTFPKKYFRF